MRPQIWIVAGPNGSGKTTFTRKYLSGRLPVINPDDIAAIEGVSPIRAGKLAISRQRGYLDERHSFAFETTLSGQHEIDIMSEAASLGYKVNLIFIAVGSAAMSIGRVCQRVVDGGHNVPAVDIVRRFSRSMDNLPQALQLANRAFLLDNIKPRPRLLISIDDGRVKRAVRDLPQWAHVALSTYRHENPRAGDTSNPPCGNPIPTPRSATQ